MPCSTLRTDYDICRKQAARAHVDLERMGAGGQAAGQFHVQFVPRRARIGAQDIEVRHRLIVHALR